MYITAKASEGIVDTLNFSPRDSPMPQMSSTDRILMATQDMEDALKHPHPDIHFATIGDDKISALKTLAEIFTRKFKKVDAQNIQTAPQDAAATKQQNSQPQPKITSPTKKNHQQPAQTNVNQAFENVQQPPRVVAPATRPAAPPRVQARTRQLSPRNFYRDFLDIGGANCAIVFGKNHWTTTTMMNAVTYPVTGKEMQYKDLLRDPYLGPLFEIGLSNELGRICQGIRDIAGTNTAFFVALTIMSFI
jgi:hypothetical protein